jgi:mRNA interferase MazF
MARTNRRSTFTYIIQWAQKASLIRTSKIATLDKTLAKGLLGALTNVELNDLNNKLKALLQLP